MPFLIRECLTALSKTVIVEDNIPYTIGKDLANDFVIDTKSVYCARDAHITVFSNGEVLLVSGKANVGIGNIWYSEPFQDVVANIGTKIGLGCPVSQATIGNVKFCVLEVLPYLTELMQENDDELTQTLTNSQLLLLSDTNPVSIQTQTMSKSQVELVCDQQFTQRTSVGIVSNSQLNTEAIDTDDNHDDDADDDPNVEVEKEFNEDEYIDYSSLSLEDYKIARIRDITEMIENMKQQKVHKNKILIYMKEMARVSALTTTEAPLTIESTFIRFSTNSRSNNKAKSNICRLCSMDVKSDTSLQSHLNGYHLFFDFKCNKCCLKTYSSPYLNIHQSRPHIVPYGNICVTPKRGVLSLVPYDEATYPLKKHIFYGLFVFYWIKDFKNDFEVTVNDCVAMSVGVITHLDPESNVRHMMDKMYKHRNDKKVKVCKSFQRAVVSHQLRPVYKLTSLLPIFTNSHQVAQNLKYHLRSTIKSIAIYKSDLNESYVTDGVIQFIENFVLENDKIFIETDQRYTLYEE